MAQPFGDCLPKVRSLPIEKSRVGYLHSLQLRKQDIRMINSTRSSPENEK